MVFKQFDLNSADELLPYLEKCPYLGSDFTLGYLLMWHKELNVQYCITKDTFIIRYDLDDLASFTFPFGPHTHEVLIDLIEFIKNNCDLTLKDNFSYRNNIFRIRKKKFKNTDFISYKLSLIKD